MAFSTFDPGNLKNVTLTGSNLIATGNSTASIDQGVFGLDGFRTGKKYFEFTWNVKVTGNFGTGFALNSATFPNLENVAANGVILFNSMALWINGGSAASVGGTPTNGSVMQYAVDFDAHLVWVRLSTGLWNGSGTADPATGVGGKSFPAGLYFPVVIMPASNTAQVTLNAGGSSFVGTVPSGFTSGLSSPGDPGKSLVTQEFIEVLSGGGPSKARVTQHGIAILSGGGPSKARVTQYGIEVLMTVAVRPPPSGASQPVLIINM